MAEEKARDPTMPERKPVNIPLSKIHDLPGSVFAPPSPKSLEALTSSIVLKGIQEPVILRQREDGEFQIVSGNRRRKASELTKKAEIPAFVYDMTEKEAKEFRFRDKGIGTPPGRLLSESEIGKKREEPAKAPEQAAEVKPVPAPEQKKTEEKTKTVEAAQKAEEAQKAVSSEKAGIDGKKPDTPPKSPEKAAEEKTAPAPDIKKPVENTPPAASAEKADAAPKKQDTPPKQPDKPADTKPDTDSKKPPVPEKSPETPAAAKPMPAAMTGPAALGPTGTKITKIFEDRLLPPDEKAKKALPVPKEGESYFITLHPAYLEKSEFNTVSVDVNSDDYKELKKSIELNGVKDPVLTRINAKGGLEILSGQRRHMIARELNYPVPAIIQKIDDNDAMILVADSNLHRPHISTFDLSRTLRNKMTAMKRKAGRKKRGVPGAEELNSDAVLAKEMGISVSKLNRILRLSEATKDVCEAVDDNSIDLSVASEISFLKPHNQDEVIHLSGIGYKPNVKRVQRLRAAEKEGKLDDMTMRRILEDKDLQPVKPPEQPKPAPVQTAPPLPATPTVTPSVPAPAPAVNAPPVSPEPITQPEPPKQEHTPQPPAMQATKKPNDAPAQNVPAAAPPEADAPQETKASEEEPIEFNSQRDNMYATKVTLGGDRLRKYFPDTSMPPLAIIESIYSALEERRQRELRMKQKTEILHPVKSGPTR
jgi:hypothetical protein